MLLFRHAAPYVKRLGRHESQQPHHSSDCRCTTGAQTSARHQCVTVGTGQPGQSLHCGRPQECVCASIPCSQSTQHVDIACPPAHLSCVHSHPCREGMRPTRAVCEGCLQFRTIYCHHRGCCR